GTGAAETWTRLRNVHGRRPTRGGAWFSGVRLFLGRPIARRSTRDEPVLASGRVARGVGFLGRQPEVHDGVLGAVLLGREVDDGVLSLVGLIGLVGRLDILLFVVGLLDRDLIGRWFVRGAGLLPRTALVACPGGTPRLPVGVLSGVGRHITSPGRRRAI